MNVALTLVVILSAVGYVLLNTEIVQRIYKYSDIQYLLRSYSG